LKKTKVFIDIFYYKAALSGIKTYIAELTSAAKDHGSNKIEYVISHDISKIVNNQFFVNSRFKLVRWIFQIRYIFWKQIFLPIILYRNKIDYIICPDYIAPAICPSKKIVVIHDNLFWKYPLNYPKLWRKYFVKLIEIGIDNETQIVTTSNYSKIGLSKIFKNSSIKPIYQSSEYYIDRINCNEKIYITHIGTFEKRKDLMTLVKAFQNVINSGYLNIKLVLAGSIQINGSNDIYLEIKSFVKNNKLEDFVEIPGYLKKQDVKELLSKTLIYVFPSLDEGFGIPLIEAMNSDIPVVCSDIEIFKEIGKNSVLYFKASDANDLSKQIIKILNDNKLQSKLIKAGKTNVKKFNRKNFISSFEKLF